LRDQAAIIEDNSVKLLEMRGMLDQKERLYAHIKDQVEEMAREMGELQGKMREREEEARETIAQLRKELKQ
jgi:hypothetical protein